MKVLIVSSQPYNLNEQSRMLASYFYNWKKTDLATFYIDSKKPNNFMCSSYYQITDKMILHAFLKNKRANGVIYSDENIIQEDLTYHSDSSFPLGKNKIFKIKKNSFSIFLRNIIWKKKIWMTKKLHDWIIDFAPDVIFLSLHNNAFFNIIAYTLAKEFNLPIFVSVADDYYFSSKHISLNLWKVVNGIRFRNSFKKLLSLRPKLFYISPRMKEKYNSYFRLDGEVQFLCPILKPSKNTLHISDKKLKFIFFGVCGLGRIDTVLKIDNIASKLSNDYQIDIFPNFLSNKQIKKCKKHKNILIRNRVSYSELLREMKEYHIVLICESFKKSTSIATKYSLSTKVSDCLASNKTILAVGNKNNGTIDFCINNKIGFVATNKKELKNILNVIMSINIEDVATLKCDNYKKILKQYFNLNDNLVKFRRICVENKNG